MAIYHLNHRYVGKTASEPGTAAAKVRYMTRAKACDKIVTVGLATHPKALERAANQNEQTSRKNARVCDTFHIALPIEMTLEERIATTRSFLWQLTDGGRAKAFAAFHGMDSHNPHIHVMFFDRDEDGKRVQAMSERGSTERIRELWEKACNTSLEEYGYEQRIDRRTLLEQELDAPNRPEAPLESEEDLEAPTEPMEGYIQDSRLAGETHERIQYALEQRFTLTALRHDRAKLVALRQQVEAAEKAAASKYTDLQIASYEATRVEFHAHQAEKVAEATPKGFGLKIPAVKLFGVQLTRGLEYQTIQRQEWEAAQVKKEALAQQVEVYSHIKREKETDYQRTERLVRELAEAQHKLEFELRTKGDEQELDQAERILETSLHRAMKELSPMDVAHEMEVGNITPAEMVEAWEMMGAKEYLEAYRDAQKRMEEDVDEGITLNNNPKFEEDLDEGEGL